MPKIARLLTAFGLVLATANCASAQTHLWRGYHRMEPRRFDPPSASYLNSTSELGRQDIVPTGYYRELDRLPSAFPQDSGQNGQAAASGGDSAGGDSSGGAGDLAAQSQNPISSLVSLPLQSNWNLGIGPEDRTQYVGNLQPVVPVKLNDEWNLVNRVIVPFINTPIGDTSNTHGIGNIAGQWFFTPSAPSTFIWGVGPSVIFPTASDPSLGLNEWQTGINGVALISKDKVVAGALLVQTWSVHGTSKPFLFQPFFNYNLPEGWFINISGEANADWEVPEENRWSFPFGGGIGRVMPILGQPTNLSVRFAPYLESPDGGPKWQFRFAATLLFPKS